MQSITIIGLGLIGGSLGMALKQAAPYDVEITGHDKDRKAISQALKMEAMDRGERDLERATRNAQLVIIATPVLAIREVMEAIGPILEEGCIVTDTGSTKAEVMSWAEKYLPSAADFVGGHPMAGKETPGIENADADLFQGATYCVIPSPTASNKAVETVTGLVESVGAVPFFPNPEEHDALVAAVSHLPLIVSSALISATASSASWREMYKLASSGFRDVTRLASTDAVMSSGICQTNREAIEHWIDRLILELEQYKGLIRDGGEELLSRLTETREARERWIRGQQVWPDEGPRVEIPTTGQRLSGMFLGERLQRHAKKFLEMQKSRLERAAEGDQDKKREGEGRK